MTQIDVRIHVFHNYTSRCDRKNRNNIINTKMTYYRDIIKDFVPESITA